MQPDQKRPLEQCGIPLLRRAQKSYCKHELSKNSAGYDCGEVSDDALKVIVAMFHAIMMQACLVQY